MANKEVIKDVRDLKDNKDNKDIKNGSQIQKNREIALRSALDQIEKSYGKGSIMKLGDKSSERGVQVIPTGA
ncbi:MAG TPA: hypothetical protein VJG85_00145, partial [Patescibacteria group bacterium]|nr:hypothetical protein [Patescibacteria group bacterium]